MRKNQYNASMGDLEASVAKRTESWKDIDDAAMNTACMYSIAVSLRRLADKLDKFYDNGITISGH